MAHHQDVSNCVNSIVHAFTDGFAVFRRLREKRRRKKSRKAGAGAGGVRPDARAGAELRLSNSLRKGPADIQTQYERNYGVVGERFAKGDAIAHASLAETLLKLNTGLVGIIASFLNHDRKETLDLDYKSLTNLSDASRAEAIDTLNLLYQRLSQSNVALYQPKPSCPRCGSLKHANCGAVATRSSSEKSRKGHKQGGGKSGSTTTSRSRSNTPTITRVPVKSSSQTQLAIVRPRNRRTGSTSSTSSAIPSTKSPSTASTAVNTPLTSPLASPDYRKADPFAYAAPPSPRDHPSAKPPANSRRKMSSAAPERPQTWPHAPAQTPQPPAEKPVKATTFPVSAPTPPPKPKHLSPDTTAKPLLAIPRRLDKATPSAYSFASDSTKLGEIPMRNWTVPFDYEVSGRLNEEALARGWPVEPREEKERERPRRRLFGFLRRGGGEE
ncbi:uncharacterized protein BDZ99DRAFT_494712 [Mytilinidion resinicola]|uniref:Uncharacterized protein n=1 Tax=Mytilinidion resinicola TaxID=574789 RepID=A0A6A6Z3I8_9PEZI|nr:uncharacterized protein BDZ99DRAFT_494712 [Mytilinidion resinicola]KAF2814817.1 hypothetical protein BDZ99DRAFT_494712 [Mytilinidion resinicola]